MHFEAIVRGVDIIALLYSKPLGMGYSLK